jgi:hypothetical protein
VEETLRFATHGGDPRGTRCDGWGVGGVDTDDVQRPRDRVRTQRWADRLLVDHSPLPRGRDLEPLGALPDPLVSRSRNVGGSSLSSLNVGRLQQAIPDSYPPYHLRTVKRRRRLPAVGPPSRRTPRRPTFPVHLDKIVRLAPEIFGTPANYSRDSTGVTCVVLRGVPSRSSVGECRRRASRDTRALSSTSHCGLIRAITRHRTDSREP